MATVTPIICGVGNYCPGFDASGRLGATSAMPCPAGTFTIASNLTSAADCTDTSVGFYASTGSSEEIACPAGTFTGTTRSPTCQLCALGTFTSSSGSTSCETCLSGHFCPAGASTAIPCLAGTFSNATNLSNAADCSVCPRGAACSTGVDAPHLCNPGSYASTEGSKQCTLCLAGSYQNAVGGLTCKPCGAGSLCPMGASMELPANCNPGTHANASAVNGQPECFGCLRGHFCGGGAAPMRMCTPGSYAAEELMEACTACSGGTYQGTSGQTSCLLCAEGSFCPPGTSAERPCPEGSYSSQLGLSHAANCTACTVGHFCATGANVPTECVPGHFADQTHMSECRPCVAGEYQESRGATACVTCPRGFVCSTGAATPVPCSGGTYSNATGVATSALCQPVGVNEWAPLGSALPESCKGLSGFFCPGRAKDAVNDPPGSKPIIMPVGSSTTTEDVKVVRQTMNLDITEDQFNETAVRNELAALYGVDPASISLEAKATSRRAPKQRMLQSSGLQIVITIEATPEASDGGTSSMSTTLEQIKSAMDAVDDSVLGASIGGALGMTNVTIVTEPAEEATMQKTVEFICPRGKWCTAGLVVVCPVDTYNELDGQDFATACNLCPAGAYTRRNASTSPADCLCRPGLFDNNAVTNASSQLPDCRTCPVGSSCDAGAATLSRLNVSVGFWRSSAESLDVRRCPDVFASDGGRASTSGCVGGQDSNTSCAEGLMGVFCKLCKDDHEGPSIYVAATLNETAKCTTCTESGRLADAMGQLLILTLALLVFIAVLSLLRCTMAARQKETVSRLFHATKPANKAKIVIGIYQVSLPAKCHMRLCRDDLRKYATPCAQILTRVEAVYELSLPVTLREFVRQMSIICSLGLDELTTLLLCFGVPGFFARLLFWMVFPVAVVVLILVCCTIHLAMTRKLSGHHLIEQALPLMLRAGFLLYPIVANCAFEAFSCYEFDLDTNFTTSYLVSDVSIECSTPWGGTKYNDEHMKVTIVALLAVGLYPVGLIILNGALLFCAREAILAGKSTTLSRATAFLHREFEPWAFWWELVSQPVEPLRFEPYCMHTHARLLTLTT